LDSVLWSHFLGKFPVFAAQLLTIEADLELAKEVCIEKACRMVEKEAKAAGIEDRVFVLEEGVTRFF